MSRNWIPEPGEPHKDDPHFEAKVLAFRYAVYQSDEFLDWSTHQCECMANCVFELAKENNKLRAAIHDAKGGDE